MAKILDTLRTAPPPQIDPSRPLLGTFTSASQLPLSPIEYLTATIDSVAPLLKIRQQRGLAGGGASVPIPIPLGIKQRRRTAMQWILAGAEKRRDTKLADRVAKEIIAVAEGKSSIWDRRAQVHKLAVTARSNVRIRARRK
jgi:ribosomal protein S7